MLSTELQPAMETNDAQLVAQCLTGSREAFGRIVDQYQSLVCSLAYSATGSLTASEDLAQETFVIAWQQLRQLREPAKLRSWLCSIARSVISNSARRHTREPAHAAESLDHASQTPTPEPIPCERAINREEEAILWRSLEQIPELYREPLVLFYREQQSIAHVAENVKLTEDTVKQRLSRGRKMLTDEVTAFVEGTLRRSNPGKAFTLGVLAALPLYSTSAKAAALGATAAKGSATAKAAATLGIFSALIGPVVGILAGIMGTRININSARSPRERQIRVKTAWLTWSVIIAFNIVMFGGSYLARPYWNTHTVLITWLVVAHTVIFAISIWAVMLWSFRQSRRLEREAAAAQAADPNFAGDLMLQPKFEYRSAWSFLGLPLIHLRFGGKFDFSNPVKAWIAGGNVAFGLLFATGGIAVAPICLGGLAFGGVAIGGIAVGALGLGGIGLGYFATGGLALGYLACGGAAIAWLGASGGAAVAHYFALGGSAVAQHANDPAAQTFMHQNFLLSHAYLIMDLSIFLCVFSTIPAFLYSLKNFRQRLIMKPLPTPHD